MVSIVKSSTLIGVDGLMIDVETDLSNGLPSFDIVGLPDSAVKESKERVRSAIKNSELDFPIKRITVNLAPADIKKKVLHLICRLLWEFCFAAVYFPMAVPMNI